MLAMKNIDNIFLRRVTSSIMASSVDARGCVSSDIPVIKPSQEVFSLLESAIDFGDSQGPPPSTAQKLTAAPSTTTTTAAAAAASVRS